MRAFLNTQPNDRPRQLSSHLANDLIEREKNVEFYQKSMSVCQCIFDTDGQLARLPCIAQKKPNSLDT